MQAGDLVGQELGHYRIKRQIGLGGMATVFLAEDIHLGREVALKVFWPRPGETRDFLRRFAREARVLAQLDHPHILPVYDYGERDELAYLVTPYMSGGTLKQLLRERRALPPSEAIQLISQVLPALQYAHDRNLIHRDIKPGNLLFKADGSLVLADFGLVKVVEGAGSEGTPLQTLSDTGKSITGTPEYMAPEQIEGRAVMASDIYSVGIVLYEMVTGQRPFTGESLLNILMKHVNETPCPPHELNPYVSPQLEAVIQKAMAKEPQKRFARPADFLQALRQAGNPASPTGAFDQYATQGAVSAYGPALATERRQTPVPPEPGMPPQNTPLPAQSAATPWQQGPMVLPAPAASGGGPAGPTVPSAGGGSASPATPLPLVQAWRMSQTVAPSSTPTPSAPAAPAPRRSRLPVVVLATLLVLLVGLVASLFITPLGPTIFGLRPASTPTSVIGSGTPGHALTPGGTQTMPQTTTTCPASGQVRFPVMPSLTRGYDSTIVYIVNESDASGNPTYGTIKLFNTVTGAKTELAKTNHTRVTGAQVSNDGNWVLFVATVDGESELRLVRMDGQGLQTLFCAPSNMLIRDVQWSVDQTYVIFDEFPRSGGAPAVYLLNLSSGALQVEMPAPATGLALIPRTWLDAHRVLMVGIVPDSDAPPQNVYLLDINKGANQSLAGVQRVFLSTRPCWDFDSSYDEQSLFLAQCMPAQPAGSGTISRQPLNGGAAAPVLDSSTLAFATVRDIDRRDINLLALASDTSPGSAGGDPAHDGLYLVKADGSAPPLRLTSTPAGQISELNAYSQYFWANVSRDESLYALETVAPGSNVYTLSYGRLSSGKPAIFASIGAGTSMSIAGWTTT